MITSFGDNDCDLCLIEFFGVFIYDDRNYTGSITYAILNSLLLYEYITGCRASSGSSRNGANAVRPKALLTGVWFSVPDSVNKIIL
jgi:hypothetical protein